MVKELPPNCERVIELGGGTGVFTRALLDHGIADDNLMVVELNEELHHHLSRRFPDVHVALGDARELPTVAKKAGYADAGQVDAHVAQQTLRFAPGVFLCGVHDALRLPRAEPRSSGIEGF